MCIDLKKEKLNLDYRLILKIKEESCFRGNSQHSNKKHSCSARVAFH